MSFGGSVAAMISSLKNNARDRKTMYDTKHTYQRKPSASFQRLLKKRPSQKEIEAIRVKLKQRRKLEAWATALIVLILASIIGIYAFQLLFNFLDELRNRQT